MCGVMAHPFFGELVSECLCVLNKCVNHFLEEDAISVKEYLLLAKVG